MRGWVLVWILQIKQRKENEIPNNSDDSDDEADAKEDQFDVIAAYRRILELMKPGETIKRSLQRLGGKSAKMSSAERWKLRKAGIVDPNAALVIEMTELTNGILTKMGNMDIYEETFEKITAKYAAKTKLSTTASSTITSAVDDPLDMYADDFDTKEKSKIVTIVPTTATDAELMGPPAPVKPISAAIEPIENEVMWEFKWKPDDEDIHGSFSSAQMQHWVEEGYFKDGVLVRKVGQENTQFNTSNRVDFELYL